MESDEMEVNERYSVHLNRLQQHLDSLEEEELLQLCTATEQQAVPVPDATGHQYQAGAGDC